MARKKATDRKPAKKTTPADMLPQGYAEALADIKARIRRAQIKAALAVNRELIALYWEIGKTILERQKTEGWGKSVVDRLAGDLQREFPGESGFSPRNIWFMRSFYVAWTEEVGDPARPGRRSGGEILKQLVSELDGKSLPPPVAEIPWGHNILLLQRLKDPLLRLWYAEQTVANGWSRAILLHQIETKLHERQGKALTNFARTLPAPQSDLAQQALKDPYCVGFLSLAKDAQERDLESGLLRHLRDFLLELGVGFAFVGSQVRLEVDGEEYFLDMLFYHLHLRCYVVIDLKMGKFQPEHAGKMDFYLSAVDDQLRHPDDRPTIGLILCKSRSRVVVEYTLRRSGSPLGVATYQTTAGELPAPLRDQLPSVEELAEELRRAETDGA